MRSLLVTAFSLGILAAFPAAARTAADTAALEQVLIESARGPEQHAALAAHFRSKADRARSQADELERRSNAAVYQRGNAGQQRFMREQRMKQAYRLRAEVEQHEAQANAHDEAARTAALLPADGGHVRADYRH